VAPRQLDQPASPKPQAQAAPLSKPETAFEEAPAASPVYLGAEQAQPVALPEHAPERMRASAEQMIAVNERLIAEQAVKLRAAYEASGAGEANVVLGIDVTGREVMVCLMCGVVDHDYRLVLTLQKDLSIDMHSEYFVVASEILRRASVPFSSVVFDDRTVAVIRHADEPHDFERDLARFELFRDRHHNPEIQDGTVLDWMRLVVPKWYPGMKISPNVGPPMDHEFFQTAAELAKEVPGPTGIMLAKMQPPPTSLRGEARSARDISAVQGVAIGENADETARRMGVPTIPVMEWHDARSSVFPTLDPLLKSLSR
jgi:hypothetical protein